MRKGKQHRMDQRLEAMGHKRFQKASLSAGTNLVTMTSVMPARVW